MSLKSKFEEARDFKYDAVIRHRTDFILTQNLILDEHTSDLSSKVYVPLCDQAARQGGIPIRDMFAVSSSENMDYYSSLFTHVDEVVKAGGVFRPEPMLYFYLKNNKKYRCRGAYTSVADLVGLNIMQKIGVALSLYNKVNELKTNVSIIRKHWSSNNDAFISVCCNDPSSVATVEALDVTTTVIGDDIPTTTKAHRRFRIFDCIRKSISACEADFIIHFHSDAYAIRAEPIIELIEKMEELGAKVAFRGRGAALSKWQVHPW